MPTYLHQCQDENCKEEWEDYYSMSKDPPTVCPKCNQETAKRVISFQQSRGIVELSGDDYKSAVLADGQRIKKEMYRDERKYANMLGESTYQNMQQRIDKNKR